MATRRDRSMPAEIAAPLRDMLRGLHSAAEVSEDLLRPLGGLLPPWLRKLLHDTRAAAERAGRQATRYEEPGPAEIAAAAALLETGEGDSGGLARVLTWALERALAADGARHLMISETVAALALRGAVPGAGGRASRAARLVRALSRAHVAGRVPGTGLALGDEDRARIDRALVGAMLWLMAARAEYPGDEARVLDLSMGLATALWDELAPLLADQDALALELDQLSGMI